jgi:hypothetical protein
VAVIKKQNVGTKKVAITSKGKTVKEAEISASKPPVMDGVQPKKRPVEQTPQGYATIALGQGVTLNMDNFQSARLDVFIQRNVVDDDDTIKDEFSKMSELLQREIEKQSAELYGDEEDE